MKMPISKDAETLLQIYHMVYVRTKMEYAYQNFSYKITENSPTRGTDKRRGLSADNLWYDVLS